MHMRLHARKFVGFLGLLALSGLAMVCAAEEPPKDGPATPPAAEKAYDKKASDEAKARFLKRISEGGAAGSKEEARPTKAPKWAEPAPVVMRGHLSGGRFIDDKRDVYLVLGLIGDEVRKFDSQDVEVKGWKGADDEKPYELKFQLSQAPQVLIPWHWSIPFVLLLACIACMPFINKHFWEHHYHHIAIGLGLYVALGYILILGAYGQERMIETALEYFKFIALIGSLFVVTGGILVDISGPGRPVVNTAILAIGAVIANIIGTTGASALLIRPYLRINKERMRPFHVVLFIFIVSNCGGALTPIGDPPLFLGYLYGVPFHWTIIHCGPAWAVAVGVLLCAFFLMDSAMAKKIESSETTRVKTSGAINVLCLGVVLLGVFLDKMLEPHLSEHMREVPFGAILMVAAAVAAYKLSNKENLVRNEFNFGPIKEVGFLFVGIFATMVPALDYLAANAEKLGVTTPGGFYFGSGALSSFLDNAPTYLNFLSAAHGLKGIPLSPENMPQFIAQHGQYLLAVSLGSVLFGACSYIGNGPNFMVKAIADSSGAQTPSFFGYIFKYSIPLLVLYVAIWAIFLR